MKKTLLSILYVIILIAALLGIYAQDLAYYFADYIFHASPMKVLIIVTITSISLFLISFFVIIYLAIKHNDKSRQIIILFSMNVILGGLISLWSLFVLVMWWG